MNRWRHRGAAPRGKGWIVYARSTTIQAQPSSIDAGVAHIRDAVMPRLQEVDGCVGLSLLADQRTGRCIVTTAWETEEAMRASAEQIQPIRDQAAQAFGGTGSPMVEEWEIAVLHRDHRSGEGACARATSVKLPPPINLTRASSFTRRPFCPSSRHSRGSAAPACCSGSRIRTRRGQYVIRQP